MTGLAYRIAAVVNAFWHMTNLANSESDITRERLIDELHAAALESGNPGQGNFGPPDPAEFFPPRRDGLVDQITEVLQHELLYGCTSTHDPRWPRRVAQRVAEALKADERAVREMLGDTEERTQINADPNGGWYGVDRRRWVSGWAAVEEQPAQESPHG